MLQVSQEPMVRPVPKVLQEIEGLTESKELPDPMETRVLKEKMGLLAFKVKKEILDQLDQMDQRDTRARTVIREK